MDSSCRKKSQSKTSQQQICCQNKRVQSFIYTLQNTNIFEGYCIWLYIMLYIWLSANNSRPLQYHIDPLNLRQIVISDTSLSHSCAGSVVLANGNDAPEASEQLQHRSETAGSPYNTDVVEKKMVHKPRLTCVSWLLASSTWNWSHTSSNPGCQVVSWR